MHPKTELTEEGRRDVKTMRLRAEVEGNGHRKNEVGAPDNGDAQKEVATTQSVSRIEE